MFENAAAGLAQALVAGGQHQQTPDWREKTYVEMKLAEQEARHHAEALKFEREQMQARDSRALATLGSATDAVKAMPFLSKLIYTAGVIAIAYGGYRVWRAFRKGAL